MHDDDDDVELDDNYDHHDDFSAIAQGSHDHVGDILVNVDVEDADNGELHLKI